MSATSCRLAGPRACQRTARPRELTPPLCRNGQVTCQAANGSISQLVLSTHDAIAEVERKGSAGPEKLRACFAQHIALLRLARAWDVALLLNSRELWNELGQVHATARVIACDCT